MLTLCSIWWELRTLSFIQEAGLAPYWQWFAPGTSVPMCPSMVYRSLSMTSYFRTPKPQPLQQTYRHLEVEKQIQSSTSPSGRSQRQFFVRQDHARASYCRLSKGGWESRSRCTWAPPSVRAIGAPYDPMASLAPHQPRWQDLLTLTRRDLRQLLVRLP